MQRNPKIDAAGGSILTFCVLLNAIILEQAYTGQPSRYRLVWFSVPLLLFILFALRGKWRTAPQQVAAKLKSSLS